MKTIGQVKNCFKRLPRNLTVFFGLLILNFVLFFSSLKNYFVSDDFDWINLTRNSSATVGQILTGNYYGLHGVGGSFRPMINVIFYLENFFFGLNPIGYHVVQLLLHVGVAFFVYLIARKLFYANKFVNQIAILSAALFSILPNHVEAVSWIAAEGDPLATLLYLISFYLYIGVRNYKLQIINFKQITNYKLQIQNSGFYIASLFFFILALLTKEIAITLPVVILAYEIIFRTPNSPILQFSKTKLLSLSIMFLTLGAYLAWRFWAIGLLFGYYGRTSLATVLHIKAYLITLINISASMLTAGQLRISLAHLIIKGWFVILPLIILAVILFWRKANIEQKRSAGFLIIFWLLNIVLILPLSLGIINDEGQRYGYLPSVAVAIIIACLLIALVSYLKKLGYLLIIITICYCILFQQILINQWRISSMFSNRVYNQLVNIDFQTPEKTYIIGLPDAYLNAQLYRNGIIQSLELQNIPFDLQKVDRVPVYVHLNDSNRNNELYSEMAEAKDGFLWTTKDNKYIVTGNATETYPDYHFELWGYNYGNATANHIRMYFETDVWQKIKEGKAQIIYFDEGSLKKLQ